MDITFSGQGIESVEFREGFLNNGVEVRPKNGKKPIKFSIKKKEFPLGVAETHNGIYLATSFRDPQTDDSDLVGYFTRIARFGSPKVTKRPVMYGRSDWDFRALIDLGKENGHLVARVYDGRSSDTPVLLVGQEERIFGEVSKYIGIETFNLETGAQVQNRFKATDLASVISNGKYLVNLVVPASVVPTVFGNKDANGSLHEAFDQRDLDLVKSINRTNARVYDRGTDYENQFEFLLPKEYPRYMLNIDANGGVHSARRIEPNLDE